MYGRLSFWVSGLVRSSNAKTGLMLQKYLLLDPWVTEFARVQRCSGVARDYGAVAYCSAGHCQGVYKLAFASEGYTEQGEVHVTTFSLSPLLATSLIGDVSEQFHSLGHNGSSPWCALGAASMWSHAHLLHTGSVLGVCKSSSSACLLLPAACFSSSSLHFYRCLLHVPRPFSFPLCSY